MKPEVEESYFSASAPAFRYTQGNGPAERRSLLIQAVDSSQLIPAA
jgi:hypothetical protein